MKFALSTRKFKKFEEKSDESEAYSRRDTILLSGNDLPAGSSTENCTQVVMDIVKSKLKLTINPSDISIALRIGKHLASTPDRRTMLVKLCRRDLKTDLIGAVKTMKPSNFYIPESLTPQNETISYVLIRARKDFDQIISGGTMVDGINYVWVKPLMHTSVEQKISDIKFRCIVLCLHSAFKHSAGLSLTMYPNGSTNYPNTAKKTLQFIT